MKNLTKKKVAFIIFAVFLAVGSFILWSAEPVTQTQPQLRTPTPTREELFDLTNKERVEAGVDPLLLDGTLNTTAQEKCNDLVSKNEFKHGDNSQMAEQLNRQVFSENLAEGYANSMATVNGWMSSSSHRDALVNARYTRVGFGICESKNGTLVVQHFSN